MHEIRMHGRGGQGTVVAASILATALIEEGKCATAIPAFGFERRGAPVAAFLRVDDKNIRQVTNVYRPDIVICFDPTIPKSVDIFANMSPGGTVLQSTKRKAAQTPIPPHVLKIGVCDAVGIALRVFQRTITSPVMLGAFAFATGLVSLRSLEAALEHGGFRDAGIEQNLEAMRRGYEETEVLQLSAGRQT